MVIPAIIHTKDVASVVDYLRESTTLISDDMPLLYLQIVESVLDDAQVMSEQTRIMALLECVVNIVSDEYLTQCRRVGLNFSPPVTRDEALIQLDQLCRLINSKLTISLAYLYYCHVLYDYFSITIDEFIGIIATSERNLRRMKQYGIEYIQKCIIQAEEQARIRRRDWIIRSSLPNLGKTKLIGREKLLSEALETVELGKKLAFIGEKGVGKTSFIEALVIELARQEIINHVLWLNNDSSNEIDQFLSAYSPSKHFYLQDRLLIVLDTVDISLLNYTVEHLPMATIIIIDTSLDVSVDAVIRIPPLNVDSILAMAYQQIGKYKGFRDDIDNAILAHFTQNAHGNPENLIKLVSNYFNDSADHIIHETQNDLQFICLQLTSHGFIDIDKLCVFWGEILNKTMLLDHPSMDYFTLDGKLLGRIHANPINLLDEGVISRIHQEIDTHILFLPDIGVQVLYGLLKHGLAIKFSWINTLLQSSSMTNNLIWFQLLENLLPELDVDHLKNMRRRVLVSLSVHYRHIGKPEKYLTELEFLDDATALLEIVHCYRSLGRYEDAFRWLLRLQASRAKQDILHQAWLLQAQLYLDIGNISQASVYIQKIPESNESQQVKLCRIEIAIRLNQLQTNLVDLNLLNTEQSSLIQLHYLRGLANFNNDTDYASNCFLSASNLIQQQPIVNLFLLSRCLSNVAACYIKSGRKNLARTILDSVKLTQQKIGDKMGLLYTQKNLDSL